MNTIPQLLHLPPEVSDMILTYLKDARSSLRSLRLVCRYLQDVASPFLFATIMIAKRRTAIDNAFHIIQHLTFSQYVETLVYDASTYAATGRPEFDADEEIEDFITGVKIRERIQGSDSQRLCEEQAYHLFQAFARTESWLIENGLRDQVLRAAIKLPKLKHIIFTDYRAFAEPWEPWNNLWHRLFSATPPPRNTSDPRCDRERELTDLLRLADEHQLRLESFNCGKNPYACEGLGGDRSIFFQPCGLPLDALFALSRAQALQNLSRLRLVLFSNQAREASASTTTTCLRALLQSIRPNLSQLTLHLINEHTNEQMRATQGPSSHNQLHGYFPDDLVDGCPLRFFALVFRGLHFSKLRALDLGGMPFHDSDFRAFLTSHSDSLRLLYLRYCLFEEGSGRELGEHRLRQQNHTALCRWVIESLSLEGFEFYSVLALPEQCDVADVVYEVTV